MNYLLKTLCVVAAFAVPSVTVAQTVPVPPPAPLLVGGLTVTNFVPLVFFASLTTVASGESTTGTAGTN